MNRRMNREDMLDQLRNRESIPWDIVVIGGGATGVSIAMDAATRGLDVLLLEQSDFGKGTSSRSTKLVHGGVRYLQQGNFTLVRDALRERSLLRHNAPHLVHDMPFLIPCKNTWQKFFYWFGLKLYDFLATGKNFGRSHGVSANEALRHVPTLNPECARGGVIYHDGQFDDSRLLINMATTACQHGACLLNYFTVKELLKSESGKIIGVIAEDQETKSSFSIPSKSVINAAGPFCDEVRRMDESECEAMLATSQGVHIVLHRRFFPGSTAMIIPKTSDGRVLFIIPWHDHAVVGTTDTPIETAVLEPIAKPEEIQFLLDTAKQYLVETPTRDDILSVFVGIRPLIKGDRSARTASLSRDHMIRISDSGLITITGGKWTTVRKMSEDCVDRAIKEFHLSAQACATQSLPIHGSAIKNNQTASPRSYYGSDLQAIEAMERNDSELSLPMHDRLFIHRSDVVWAARYEMARTIEDVLARRTRALFLNSQAAISIAPQVAELLASELGRDEKWISDQIESFSALAKCYSGKLKVP